MGIETTLSEAHIPI